MKKINKSIQFITLLIVCLLIPSQADAQVVKNMYFNVDWDINTPFGNDFADKTSGWGAQGEAGYYILPNVAVGAFLSYHTNNKYIDRKTLAVGENAAVTSDQQHSLYQLPFGAALRYSFDRKGLYEPYVSAKLGANYSEMLSYMNIMKVYDRSWGVYVAPEVGMNIFFTPEKKYGLHLAAYYSYATNSANVLTYSMDGINNWGVRFGVVF